MFGIRHLLNVLNNLEIFKMAGTSSQCKVEETAHKGYNPLNESVPPVNEINQSLSKETLKFIFECPNCHLVPTPPVSSCSKNGHIICSSCRKTTRKCTVANCNGVFSNDGKNAFYENMFENIVFKCRYTKDGCKVALLGKDIKAHQENTCQFRPINCLIPACQSKTPGNYFEAIPYSKFITHFKLHKGKIISSNTGIIYNEFDPEMNNWRSGRWAQYAFEYKGFTFFIVSQVAKPLIGIWCWILGTEEDARLFNVRFALGQEGSSSVYKWKGDVCSIRTPDDKIMADGTCFFIPYALLKNYLFSSPSQKKVWSIRVFIVDAHETPASNRNVQTTPLNAPANNRNVQTTPLNAPASKINVQTAPLDAPANNINVQTTPSDAPANARASQEASRPSSLFPGPSCNINFRNRVPPNTPVQPHNSIPTVLTPINQGVKIPSRQDLSTGVQRLREERCRTTCHFHHTASCPIAAATATSSSDPSRRKAVSASNRLNN